MSEPTLADRLFQASRAYGLLDEEAGDKILEITNLQDQKNKPQDVTYEDIIFDDYDNSFEIKDVSVGWVPTREMVDQLFALGFARFWICYEDGSERHYVKGQAPVLSLPDPPENVDVKTGSDLNVFLFVLVIFGVLLLSYVIKLLTN